MRNALKDYFSFSSRDIRGIYILLGILILLLIVSRLPKYFIKHPEADFTQLEKNILIFEKAQRAMKEHERTLKLKTDFDFNRPDYSAAKQKLTPFPFDPNQMTAAEWKKLGLSEKQVKGIMNYIAAGGLFRKKEDLKKLYSLTPNEYEILEPFIQIQPRDENLTSTRNPPRAIHVMTRKDTIAPVHINTADSAKLVKIGCISPVIAGRIIRYRDILGGFYNNNQLLEVYGLDSACFRAIKKAFVVDQSKLRKININHATVKEMSRHPYIDFYLAKSIVDQRIKQGRILSVEETSAFAFMHTSRYEKLFPYLTTE